MAEQFGRNRWAAVIQECCAEHAELMRLFNDYEAADTADAGAALLRHLCAAIRLHYMVEAGVIYPVIAAASKNPALLTRAGQQYAAATALLSEVENCDPGGDTVRTLCRQLQARVEEHIALQEKPNGVFSKAQRLDIDWQTLAEKVLHRRAELAR